jgi:AraC-like DNA-binding protein
VAALVDVVALLAPVLLTQLRVALGPPHRLVAAADWAELDRLVRRTAVDVAVLDPCATGGDGVADVVGFLSRHPSVPVVTYVTLTPASLRAVVELARHGLQQVVLHRFDDDPPRFRELLARQAGDALTEELLAALAPALRRLPPALAGAVKRMFRRPHLVWNAQDLAAAAGMPRRTLYRQLAAAGFASPRRLVQAARLLRAYVYLRDPGNLVEDVVVKLRYGSSHAFVRHTREACGLTPSALRRDVEGAEFVALLRRRLLAG